MGERHKSPKRAKDDAYDFVNDLEYKYRPPVRVEDDYGYWATGRGHGGQKRDNEFPIDVDSSKRKRDSRLERRASYARQRRTEGGLDLGSPTVTDEDLRALEDIDRERQQLSFESWISSYFDVSDPPTAKIISEIYPEYWTKREAAIRKQAELQTDLALIRLRGPTTKKDLLTLYALSTGRVPFPRGSIFEPKSWSSDNTQLTRGLLNPRRYMSAGGIEDKRDPIGSLMRQSLANRMYTGRFTETLDKDREQLAKQALGV